MAHESRSPYPVSFRDQLQTLFHSYKFHLAVVALVILDCIIVIAELLLELNTATSEAGRQDHHHLSLVLHCTSLAILSAFTIEIGFKIYAFRADFLHSKTEVFDAFVVISSLVLDIIFFDHDASTAIIGDLIVLLRLWRVVRVVHGIIVSVKTPLEHSLEKERDQREQAERRVEELTQQIGKLEEEIARLKSGIS